MVALTGGKPYAILHGWFREWGLEELMKGAKIKIVTTENAHNTRTGATRRDFVTAGSAAFLSATMPFLGVGAASSGDARKAKKRIWIDTHVHVSDVSRDGRKKREKLLDDMLELLDREHGADLRFVVSSDMCGYGAALERDPAAMLPANRMIYELCRRAPGRLYGSCLINPNFTDEALRVMKICFEEWGFVQIGEMEQCEHHYKMTDPGTEKVIKAAVGYDVPMQVHVGTYINWRRVGPKYEKSEEGFRQLADMMQAAERVPEAKFIIAHAIGCGPNSDYIPWAGMIIDTLKTVYPTHPRNFWLEIRDFHCPALPRAIRELPTDRLLCGTDYTTRIGPPFQTYGTMFGVKEENNPYPPGVETFVGFLRKAGASESDISRIAYENARELYKFPA